MKEGVCGEEEDCRKVMTKRGITAEEERDGVTDLGFPIYRLLA